MTRPETGADTADAVEAFVAALVAPSAETREALHARLAGAVEVFAGFGVGTGPGVVDHLVDHPLVARLAGGADWSDPVVDGDLVVVDAVAPPAALVGGLRFGLHVDPDGRIDRLEQDIIPAAPASPTRSRSPPPTRRSSAARSRMAPR